MIRKSSYGRTNFFEEGTHFKQCNSTVVPVSTSSVFHTLPPLEEESELRRRQILCWHCCHPIFPSTNGAKRKRKGKEEGGEESTTRVYRAPRMYDPQNSTFHVYGYFCSPSCIKTYVLDHTSFDRGEHMYAFVKMMKEVYGVEEDVKEAPPREMLLSFGGPLPLSEFRTMTNECEIVKPPFVSYRMIVEERTPSLSLHSAPKPEEGTDPSLSQKGEGDVVVVQGEGEGDKKVLYTRGVKGMRRKRQDESDFLPPSPRQEGEYDPEAGFTQTAATTSLPKRKKESSTPPVFVVEKQTDASASVGGEEKKPSGGLARFQKKK